ncbi:hypothetical protein N7526_004042 [Penicillium atrosanguineum]|nr:hypothetical protein N7526_004042 [Penicillium atrosanguineum]
MSIPEKCTVLVVGGGPGGSYAASVLAREGISTVLLEADSFPRYHIGESLLPSTREFLKFIDVYDKFESHGFIHKVGMMTLNGASFSYNSKPPAYTNFLAFGGHAWNVIRSECDQILFKHAGDSGAKTFDGVKVNAIKFQPSGCQESHGDSSLGWPISASWARKDKTASGTIHFKYLVDASGRAGLISTKYMKNRRYNEGLKNIATWGYFEGAGMYGMARHKEAVPSPTKRWNRLGLVHSSSQRHNFRRLAHQDTPVPASALSGMPGALLTLSSRRVCILAFTGALSAAASICAAIKGDCTEQLAANWHSEKIREAYTRFLLVVTSAYAQITGQERPVLNEYDEENFDRAFSFFRPIIQGTVEIGGGKLSPEDVADSVEFCMRVIRKVDCTTNTDPNGKKPSEDENGELTCDRIKKAELKSDINKFRVDIVNGMTVNLQQGALGLVKMA